VRGPILNSVSGTCGPITITEVIVFGPQVPDTEFKIGLRAPNFVQDGPNLSRVAGKLGLCYWSNSI